jgi:hypothetical protein
VQTFAGKEQKEQILLFFISKPERITRDGKENKLKV